jgi:hypothetical protein
MPSMVRVYRHDDPGAPFISTAAGTWISVLDACLVTGYGAKEPAGWTKLFSGTNQAVYQQGAGGLTGIPPRDALRFCLRVDDTIGDVAAIRGYEDMASLDTGTRPFPTPVKFADPGVRAIKVTGSHTRWFLVADHRTLYYFGQAYGLSLETSFCGMAFGDYESFVDGDRHQCLLVGRQRTTTGEPFDQNDTPLDIFETSLSATHRGHWLARDCAGVTPSVPFAKITNGWNGSLFSPWGELGFDPVWIYEPQAACIRGRLRGFWAVRHGKGGLTSHAAYTCTGFRQGRSFLVPNTVSSTPLGAVEVSSGWGEYV